MKLNTFSYSTIIERKTLTKHINRKFIKKLQHNFTKLQTLNRCKIKLVLVRNKKFIKLISSNIVKFLNFFFITI